MPGLLTISRTEAITAWRALCSSKGADTGLAAPGYSPRHKEVKADDKVDAAEPITFAPAKLGIKDARDVYLLRFESAAMLKTGQ